MNQTPIVKFLTVKTEENAQCAVGYDKQFFTDFNYQMLDANYWQQHGKVVGVAQGRGTTWFIQHNQHQFVLRHYYRGGLVGKINRDRYLFLGKTKTRAQREFDLLCFLQQQNLPTPAPVAFRVIRDGIWYRADILTQRIVGASDLVAILTQQALTDEQWFNVGKMIAKFHAHNVNHHDLNCHNILFDSAGDFWLIDFDQGQIMANAGQWRDHNLKRLLRSFLKEQKKLPVFHWQLQNWQSLQQGYLASLSGF